MRIFVGNLSYSTEEPQLEQLFSAHGTVDSVHLVRDHATGRSRGFAFVEMSSDSEATCASAPANVSSSRSWRSTYSMIATGSFAARVGSARRPARGSCRRSARRAP